MKKNYCNPQMAVYSLTETIDIIMVSTESGAEWPWDDAEVKL